MEKQFRAISVSHKSAPIEIREQFSLTPPQQEHLLLRGKEVFQLTEAFIISTCNRTEVYFTSDQVSCQQFSTWFLSELGLPLSYKPYIHSFDQSASAIRHLFRMACGVESQILGDYQIITQVKESYQTTCNLDLAGAYLHRLLHTIFYTHKKISNETNFRSGAASVSYAAVVMGMDLIKEVEAPKVLVLGAGEMASDISSHLQKQDAEVTIANRTHHKAVSLATEHDHLVEDWSETLSHLTRYDLILSAVSCQDPIIEPWMLPTSKRMVLIDLGVPRSVSKNVTDSDQLWLFGIDHIHDSTREVKKRREVALAKVLEIIDESVNEFDQWAKQYMMSPYIQQIKKSLDEIRKQELQRSLCKIDDSNRVEVELMTERIVQKVVKMHVVKLKAACQRDDLEMADVVSSLFEVVDKDDDFIPQGTKSENQ